VWVDRQGKETPLPLPPRSYLYPHLSPDGKQLAVEVEGPSHDFFVYDFARSVLTKMTHDGLSHAPVWSPDGKQLGFRSWKLGGMTIWSMPADRSRRFLMVKDLDQDMGSNRIIVVLNWTQELSRLMSQKKS
jgi:Tol biopolymer transport system component